MSPAWIEASILVRPVIIPFGSFIYRGSQCDDPPSPFTKFKACDLGIDLLASSIVVHSMGYPSQSACRSISQNFTGSATEISLKDDLS